MTQQAMQQLTSSQYDVEQRGIQEKNNRNPRNPREVQERKKKNPQALGVQCRLLIIC